MKRRRNIPVEQATDEELLRWEMENIVQQSMSETEYLGGRAVALAKIYNSLKYRHAGFFIGIVIILYLLIDRFVFLIQIFRRK